MVFAERLLSREVIIFVQFDIKTSLDTTALARFFSVRLGSYFGSSVLLLIGVQRKLSIINKTSIQIYSVLIILIV